MDTFTETDDNYTASITVVTVEPGGFTEPSVQKRKLRLLLVGAQPLRFVGCWGLVTTHKYFCLAATGRSDSYGTRHAVGTVQALGTLYAWVGAAAHAGPLQFTECAEPCRPHC